MLDDSTFRLLAEISIFIKELFAAHYLAVDEVGSSLVKDLKVARLLDSLYQLQNAGGNATYQQAAERDLRSLRRPGDH